MALITLLSDFGLTDPYVAEMKGVILSASPDQKIVDVSHGIERLSLVMLCERGILVGPDNGLLVRAAERLGFNTAYQIDSHRFDGEKVSSTFHGRDVFARTASKIANGLNPNSVGGEAKQFVKLDIPTASISHDRAHCTILYVDSFGNVVLN